MQYFIPVQPVLDYCLTAIYVVNQKLVLFYKKRVNYNETMLELYKIMSVLDHQRAIGEWAVLKSWLKIHDAELMTSAITIKTNHLLPLPLPISRIPFQWQHRRPIATWHFDSGTNSVSQFDSSWA